MDTLTIVSTIFGLLGAGVALNQCRIWYHDWQENRIDKFASIERHGFELMYKIRRTGFRPDFVLGLGRSGAFLGGWLAGNLGSIRIEVIDRIHKEGNSQLMDFPNVSQRLQLLKTIYGDSAKVLVVEGATTRGTTFFAFEVERKLVAPDWDCKFCVLYEVDTNMFEMSFIGKKLLRAPVGYAWHATDDYKKFIRKTRSLEA